MSILPEQFQRGMTGVERFFEILDEAPDITDDENARPPLGISTVKLNFTR